MDIVDELMIVTGAASGLGLALAQHLIHQGAKVAIWDHNPQCVEISKTLGTSGYQVDVTDEQAVQTVLAQTITDFQQTPRGLVNCAGITSAKRMVGKNGAVDLAWFSQMVNVNLIGTFNVMRLVVEKMIEAPALASKERGVIINTSSIAALDGQIGQSAYSASKGGIAAMTLPLARELAMHGIRVLAIAPGLMDTPMLQQMKAEVRAMLLEHCVFPNRLGKPEEFAALATHLLSNPLLNGEVIRLDGAIRLPG